MTVLRFQTAGGGGGGRHQTSPASLRGLYCREETKQSEYRRKISGMQRCREEEKHSIRQTPVPPELSELVGWCFEPSHPQRIISRLETNVCPSLPYSAQKSRIFRIKKINLDHKYKTKRTNIKHKSSKK